MAPLTVRLLQTADANVYRELLNHSADVNIAFCSANGFEYECYLGIKRGAAPWQATYNRIFMLNELLDSGFTGWAFYLDADAFVVNFDFDLREYIISLGDCCFHGASGGSDTPWNINAGVFLLNCGIPEGQDFIREWMRKFLALVPLHYLESKEAKWDEYPNDQDLMYKVLQENPELIKKTSKAANDLLNY